MSDVTSTFNARASQTARDASVQSKAERVTEFAKGSFERCERQWTNQFYNRLLKREGNTPTLQPSWAANDKSAHLMRAAGKMSLQRHMKNMSRIERAADRMAGRNANQLGRG
jgi:hypothetical protein